MLGTRVAPDRVPKLPDFAGCEVAAGTYGEIAEPQGPEPDPVEPANPVANRAAESTHLTFAAFLQHQREDGTVGL